MSTLFNLRFIQTQNQSLIPINFLNCYFHLCLNCYLDHFRIQITIIHLIRHLLRHILDHNNKFLSQFRSNKYICIPFVLMHLKIRVQTEEGAFTKREPKSHFLKVKNGCRNLSKYTHLQL